MANPKNVIALNGKIYDVTTGSLVSNLLTKKAKTDAPKPIKPIVDTPTIDGFKPLHHSKPAAKPALKHSQAKHHRRKPQHAKTLMRSTAKHARHSSKDHKIVEAKQAGTTARHARAEQIAKSSLIRRFAHNTSGGVVKKVGHLEVKQPTNAIPYKHAAAKSQALPSNQSSDIFSRAIERATSHREAPVKLSRHSHVAKRLKSASRTSKVTVGALLTVLILGGVVWYFLPAIQVKIASVRAGVHASLPSYQPSGFSQSSVNYKDGQVTLGYTSNSDNRSYSVEQSASKWDSETLLEKYIKPAGGGKSPIIYQDQGKTIYIYNGSDATWVNGGVWYKIHSNSSLNSDQLLRIANSL